MLYPAFRRRVFLLLNHRFWHITGVSLKMMRSAGARGSCRRAEDGVRRRGIPPPDRPEIMLNFMCSCGIKAR